MILGIVLVEILVLMALALGAWAMSHLVFWLLARYDAYCERRQQRVLDRTSPL